MPQIAETAQGPIEYDIAGEGAPVLVVHGSPGGWDQGRAMASALPPERFRAITVSRPGYLGTGLEGREGIDEQADLLAALLDTLEVERAGVLCWSGGGPSSYRLAVRHPDRVRSLWSPWRRSAKPCRAPTRTCRPGCSSPPARVTGCCARWRHIPRSS